jgi:hypothetical protein
MAGCVDASNGSNTSIHTARHCLKVSHQQILDCGPASHEVARIEPATASLVDRRRRFTHRD